MIYRFLAVIYPEKKEWFWAVNPGKPRQSTLVYSLYSTLLRTRALRDVPLDKDTYGHFLSNLSHSMGPDWYSCLFDSKKGAYQLQS